MSMPARASTRSLTALDQLRYAREIIQLEGHALANLSRRLDGEFCRAVDTLFACQGSVIASGIGKAGLIAQKVAATLASTGTRSHYLHPGEAVHGDLGRIHHDDVMLIFSQSGETEEVVRLLPSLLDFGVGLIAVTARRASTLGQAANVTVELGPLQEACSLGLAPSTSTTAMLALGDAWRWSPAACAIFAARILPASIRPAAWAGNLARSTTTCDRCRIAAWRWSRKMCARYLSSAAARGGAPARSC